MKSSAVLWIAGTLTILLTSCTGNIDHDTADTEKNGKGKKSNDTIEVQRLGRLSDLNLSSRLTEEELKRLWGPPDALRGSGVPYFEYGLEDCRTVWVTFSPKPPHQLLGAFLYDRQGNSERIFPTQN